MSTPTRVSHAGDIRNLSPIPSRGRNYELLPIRIANVPPWLRGNKEAKWVDREPSYKKYIDDGLNIDCVCLKDQKTFIRNGKCVKIVEPPRSQHFLTTVTERAELKGMRVNDSKTKVMCVAASKSYKAEAGLKARDGSDICSVTEMTVLGVRLNADASFRSHVHHVANRIRARSWTLRELKKANMNEDHLVQVY